MLRLAAREADGLILSALSSPGYLTWVQEQIAAALAARPRPLPVTVFLYTSVHEDEDIARHHAHEFVAARLATGRAGRTLRHSGHWDEVEPLLGLPAEQVRPRLRAEVVEAFVLYGTAQSCRQRLRAYAEAGVDEVALAPIPVGGVLDLAAAMPQLAQLSPAAAR